MGIATALCRRLNKDKRITQFRLIKGLAAVPIYPWPTQLHRCLSYDPWYSLPLGKTFLMVPFTPFDDSLTK